MKFRRSVAVAGVGIGTLLASASISWGDERPPPTLANVAPDSDLPEPPPFEHGPREGEPEEGVEAGCDAAAGGDLDRAELAADQPNDRTLPTPLPVAWRESRSRQCRRYHGRRTCDGPRRVPQPTGNAAEFASHLGMGIEDERRVPARVLNHLAPQAWVDVVEGEAGPGLLWPVPGGTMWRGFGRHRLLIRGGGGRLRRGRRRRLHPGVDIGAPPGSIIRAVNDGLVTYSSNTMRGYGNAVILLHSDGSTTLYAHCQATYVFAGQQVSRGQVIAEVGATGLAHGPHLHFEWHRAGRPRNPAPHFVGRPPRRGADDDQT